MGDVIDCVARVTLVGEGVSDAWLKELVEQARLEGLQLTGGGGLLGTLTKLVVESAWEGEMVDHLGYDKHDPVGRGSGNSRNGKRAKTVLTEVGPVQIAAPRDRDSSFEPRIVATRQRRLSGVEDLVISLSAKGLTTGEISAHLAEVYGAEVSTSNDLGDHRAGDGRLGRVAEPAAGCGVSGDLHRLCPRQDPRRQRCQSADLGRDGCHGRGRPRHPRAVGR